MPNINNNAIARWEFLGNQIAEMVRPVNVAGAVPLPDFGKYVEAKQGQSGPEVWDKLLAAVKEIYETDTVCVAGGAVRDHLLGVRPKDVDIFVSYEGDDLTDRLGELGWGAYQKNPWEKLYGNGFKVYSFRPWFVSSPVELIFKPFEVSTLADDFDLDICKSSYYNQEIRDTDEAKRDRENKTISLTSGDKVISLDKSNSRAERIRNHLSAQGLGDFNIKGFPVDNPKTFSKDYIKMYKEIVLNQMMMNGDAPR